MRRARFWFGVSAISAALSGVSLAQGCGGDDASPASSAGFCEKHPAGAAHNTEVGCDLRCPGDPSCKPSSDTTLYAGAASLEITPSVDYVVVFAPWNQGHDHFDPAGGDKCVKKGSCDPNDVSTCSAEDPMKCTWIAGFDTGRPATGNADPTSVRCIALKQGNTKLGLCTVDAVGWFYNEVEATRELVKQKYPALDFDFIGVAATHDHETQDTLGIWGPSDTESGVKDDYQASIREKTADALDAANTALQAVHVELGVSKVDGHIAGTDPGGHKTAAFVSDTRDPVVLDNELRTMRFVATKDSSTVATLINFCSHPEFSGSSNMQTSADYPGALRSAVEQGFEVEDSSGKSLYKQDGVGGVAIYFNGALGGQVGPGNVIHTDFEGKPVPEGTARAYNDGKLLAVYAHEAMTEGVETLETAALGLRARELYVEIENKGYHIALAQQLFHRDGYFYDKSRELGDDNRPFIKTEIEVIDVGPAELVGVPGELHAELLLATKDGKSSLDAPYPFTPAPYLVLNDPKTNPSCGKDGVSRCDDGPPAIDQMDRSRIIDPHRDPNAKYHWLLGLMQDEIGYIVPEYDYELDAQNPYLNEASPGDHYEETNSVGTKVQSEIVDPIIQLLESPSVVKRTAQ